MLDTPPGEPHAPAAVPVPKAWHTAAWTALLFGLWAALIPPAASAQTEADVTIDRGSGFARAARELGFDAELDQFERELTEEIQALFDASGVDEFLRLSANAQSLANRGLGADYATNPTGFFLGFSVGVALGTGENGVTGLEELDVPVSAGAQLALMGGYNFSAAGAPGLTVSGKALFFPLSVREFSGQFANLGAHLQFKFFGPVRSPGVSWGGIDLTVGFEWSQANLELADQDFDADLSLAQGFTVSSSWAGRLELVQSARSIPLEITSNVTLVSFLSLFAGVGVTFQIGDAGTNIDLEALSLTSTVDGEVIDVGRSTLRLRNQERADPTAFHVLGGVQLNIWKFHLFGQLTAMTRNAAVGVSTGLRFAL